MKKVLLGSMDFSECMLSVEEKKNIQGGYIPFPSELGWLADCPCAQNLVLCDELPPELIWTKDCNAFCESFGNNHDTECHAN